MSLSHLHVALGSARAAGQTGLVATPERERKMVTGQALQNPDIVVSIGGMTQ